MSVENIEELLDQVEAAWHEAVDVVARLQDLAEQSKKWAPTLSVQAAQIQAAYPVAVTQRDRLAKLLDDRMRERAAAADAATSVDDDP